MTGATPYDLWLLRRQLTGESLNGELASASEPLRGLIEHLNGLKPPSRKLALDGFLSGRSDRDQIVEALSAIDPSDPAPEVAEVDEDVPKRLRPSGLFESHPCLREPIVDELLRRTEIMNLIAPPKTGKSWLGLGLLFSVAADRRWLGRFSVKHGRVLLIDNELHPETIASRMQWVAQSMGLTTGDYDDRVEVDCLRGRLRDLMSMGPYFEAIAGQFDLVILDSGYRFTTPGDDENSNASVTQRYNCLDHYAATSGAAICYVHHSSKGSQEGKATTDIGAGAGAQSRAVDTHLVLLNDPAIGPGKLVVDAAIRSFPPIEPFVVRREGPLWVADDLAAPSVEERRQAEREAKEEQRRAADAARKEQTLLDNVGKVMEAIWKLSAEGKPATARAIRERSCLSGSVAGYALARAEDDGRIESRIEGMPEGFPGRKSTSVYRIVVERKGTK